NVTIFSPYAFRLSSFRLCETLATIVRCSGIDVAAATTDLLYLLLPHVLGRFRAPSTPGRSWSGSDSARTAYVGLTSFTTPTARAGAGRCAASSAPAVSAVGTPT
ncbi:hypothetical protein PENTCL1PPCAC_21086, partial [Pristionchus entomophagus]